MRDLEEVTSRYSPAIRIANGAANQALRFYLCIRDA